MYGVPLRKIMETNCVLKFKEHHGGNTENCHSKVECNSSYFKPRVFDKAEIGSRNLENESLESIVLKFRILNSLVK